VQLQLLRLVHLLCACIIAVSHCCSASPSCSAHHYEPPPSLKAPTFFFRCAQGSLLGRFTRSLEASEILLRLLLSSVIPSHCPSFWPFTRLSRKRATDLQHTWEHRRRIQHSSSRVHPVPNVIDTREHGLDYPRLPISASRWHKPAIPGPVQALISSSCSPWPLVTSCNYWTSNRQTRPFPHSIFRCQLWLD
jgi:hypothetical protein